MKRFPANEAGRHYMTTAAVNLRKWTVENYLRALISRKSSRTLDEAGEGTKGGKDLSKVGEHALRPKPS